MSKYIHYDKTSGKILGFYDSVIHETIPSPSLAITDEEWIDCVENSPDRKINIDTSTIEMIIPIVNLTEEKDNAKAQIDNIAEDVRLRYITGGAGQALTYEEKSKQAAAYIAADYPYDTADYLLVQAEANATGKTTTEAADTIIVERNTWLIKAAQIEETRRRGKINIDDATTIASVESIRDNVAAELNSF